MDEGPSRRQQRSLRTAGKSTAIPETLKSVTNIPKDEDDDSKMPLSERRSPRTGTKAPSSANRTRRPQSPPTAERKPIVGSSGQRKAVTSPTAPREEAGGPLSPIVPPQQSSAAFNENVALNLVASQMQGLAVSPVKQKQARSELASPAVVEAAAALVGSEQENKALEDIVSADKYREVLELLREQQSRMEELLRERKNVQEKLQQVVEQAAMVRQMSDTRVELIKRQFEQQIESKNAHIEELRQRMMNFKDAQQAPGACCGVLGFSAISCLKFLFRPLDEGAGPSGVSQDSVGSGSSGGDGASPSERELRAAAMEQHHSSPGWPSPAHHAPLSASAVHSAILAAADRDRP
eukprot:tig00000128_g7208.t1